MNIPEIRNAIIEAERFLDRAKDALSRHNADAGTRYDPSSIYLGRSRESGSLRRASLDLTRALADMRRP